jgi:hypothetical protein
MARSVEEVPVEAAVLIGFEEMVGGDRVRPARSAIVRETLRMRS